MSKSSYNFKFKKYCLSTECYNICKSLKFSYDSMHCLEFWDSLRSLGYDNYEIDCSVKMVESYYSKLTRIKKRISEMFIKSRCDKNLKIYFITLTLNDIKVNCTNKYLRNKLRRFLNDICISYIANLDYGSENDRKHYHAIILVERFKFCLDYWKKKFGFYYYEEVRSNRLDKKLLAKYILKIGYHALKDSTDKEERLIYSRNKEEKKEDQKDEI